MNKAMRFVGGMACSFAAGLLLGRAQRLEDKAKRIRAHADSLALRSRVLQAVAKQVFGDLVPPGLRFEFEDDEDNEDFERPHAEH